jgi:hypothetical protein
VPVPGDVVPKTGLVSGAQVGCSGVPGAPYRAGISRYGDEATEETTMAQDPERTVKDKNYNLVTVLQASLHWVWQMETYIADADKAGDSELAEWFRKIQESNRKAGDQGKELLAQRLSAEETTGS